MMCGDGRCQPKALACSLLYFISRLNLLNSVLTWRWDIFWDAVKHLILPAMAVGTIPLAMIARMTRSSMLEVLGQDYVRTARGQGPAAHRR